MPHTMNFVKISTLKESEILLKVKTQLSISEKQSLMDLWNKEYPSSISYNSLVDLEKYLETLANPSHYLLEKSGVILGWAFSFIREKERWFALILSEKIQRKGIGSNILDIIKLNETSLCGWVIDQENAIKKDGSHYKSPIQFYLKHDFQIMPSTRLETPTISAVKIYWHQS